MRSIRSRGSPHAYYVHTRLPGHMLLDATAHPHSSRAGNDELCEVSPLKVETGDPPPFWKVEPYDHYSAIWKAMQRETPQPPVADLAGFTLHRLNLDCRRLQRALRSSPPGSMSGPTPQCHDPRLAEADRSPQPHSVTRVPVTAARGEKRSKLGSSSTIHGATHPSETAKGPHQCQSGTITVAMPLEIRTCQYRRPTQQDSTVNPPQP